jgi:adenylyltransferase/sulfurtransferase
MIQGVARVFVPADDAPCYECTMSELDYKLLSQRRSCALLSRDDVLQGKVPTTPTVASVIGGIQVQEAIKLLHSDRQLPALAGRGYFFNGLTHDSYLIQYQRREDCPAHEQMFEIVELDRSACAITGRETLEIVQADLGPSAVVEFERELCTHLNCAKCNETREFFCSLGRVKVSDATCPSCGQICDPRLTHALSGKEEYLDRTLAQMGIPPYDIITGRAGLNMKHYLLAADRAAALGSIA